MFCQADFQFQPDRGFRQLDLSRGDHHADEHQLRPGAGLIADQFPVFLRRAILSGAPEVFREFFQFSPFVGGKVRLDGEQIPLRFPPDAGTDIGGSGCKEKVHQFFGDPQYTLFILTHEIMPPF